MNTYYSFWFRTILPIGYDANKEPQSDAERLALETMNSIVRFDPRYPNEGICERYEANLKKAAEMGYTYAWYLLGWYFQEQPRPFFYKSGFYDDFKKSEYYYKKAVSAGEKTALYGIANLYLFGCKSDSYSKKENGTVKGFEYMLEAARAGVLDAMKSLVKIFYNDIYLDEELMSNILIFAVENNLVDPRYVEYSDDGEVLVDPIGLHLISFDCIYDETLAQYWKDNAEAFEKGEKLTFYDEPSHITDLTQKAIQNLKEYEKSVSGK